MSAQTATQPTKLVLEASKEPRTENCAQHGSYISRNLFREHWSSCPVCNAESQEKQKQEELAREAAERAQILQKKIGRAGIPDRFQDRTLSRYVPSNEGQQRAHEFAMHFAAGMEGGDFSGRSAIFCGKPGTGKTHLSVGIGLHAIEWNKTVLFTTVQRMVRRVKDSWRSDSKESESDVVDLHVSPDLLILDEVGVQFGTDFERNLLFDVLNERYEKRLPTLLLSNLPAQEIKAFLGERVFDRLREDGGKCIPFDWESYRGSKQ